MSEENVILGNTPAAIDGAIVAVSQKASTAYVKQVAANLDAKKVDKSAYDAKIAEIEETLSNSASGLGERVEALEAYDKTVPGLISAAVSAEETRATGIEGGLRTDVDANIAAIAKLNGAADVAGSVAKAVDDEAALRVAADEALDARLDVIEGSGEGSVAKALADAKAYADGKETTLQAAIDGKVAKNGTDRLMTVAEGEKLAALPTNADLTSALGTKANAADVYAKSETYSATEVDGKIAPLAVKADVEASLALKANAADVYTKSQVDAKVASVFRYMGSADSVAALDQIDAPAVGDVYQVGSEEYVRTSGGTWERLGTAVDLSPYSTTVQMNSAISTAKDEAIAAAGTAADGKVAAAKAIIDAYTVNGKAISAAPVLGAADILMTGYTAVGADDVVTIETTDDINDAFRAVVSHLNTLDEVSGGAVGDLSALSGRVTAVEGAIATLNGDANTAGSVAKAVADEAARATGVEGQLRTDVDAAAAKAAANETAIGVLNGGDTVVGSVAKQVKDAVDAEATTARAAESALSARVDELEDGHVASSIPTTLEAGKRYVVTTTCNATLPAGAADGSIVEVYVLVGGAGRTIAAAGSDTILGQSLPCAIGISEEGWQLDNESYIFVKNGTNWHVL